MIIDKDERNSLMGPSDQLDDSVSFRNKFDETKTLNK